MWEDLGKLQSVMRLARPESVGEISSKILDRKPIVAQVPRT